MDIGGGTAGDTREFPRLVQGSRGKASFFPGSNLRQKLSGIAKILVLKPHYGVHERTDHMTSLTHSTNESREYESRDSCSRDRVRLVRGNFDPDRQGTWHADMVCSQSSLDE